MRRKSRTISAVRVAGIASLLFAASLAPVFAQQTTALPPLKPAQALHLPAIVQKQLPNGLKVVVLEDHRQPAVWLRLAIGAGSLRDPSDRVGLAQMTAGMLIKGTTTRTETQISDTIDGLGATLDASADQDYLTVAASGLSNYTDSLFDLMADVTLHPTFPTQEVERLRTRTLSGIVASLGQPSTVADAALSRRVYGAHPYGNFATGTPTTVKAIAQQDMVKYHDTLFVPNNATIFVTGDITADQAMAKIQARFGDWQRHDVPAGPPPPTAAAPSSGGAQITIVDRPGAAQTEVRVGLLSAGYSDPKRAIGRVASAVLGVGQFESRLTREIRVKRGLTYGAASGFDRKAQAGKFEISTFTKNASTGEVVKIALEEARKLQTELTPDDELQERKDFLNGSFAVSVATTPGVLRRLVYAVLYGAGPEDLTKSIGDTQAVTSSQIEEYMHSLPLDQPQIVLVGDASVIEPQVKAFGKVTVIPAGSLDLQSPTLLSQTEPAPGNGTAGQTPGADGKARLASAIAALGGDAFLNLKQVMLKGDGELSPPGMDMKLPISSATLIFAAPGRSRFELNTGFGDVVFGSDGTNKAWLSALGNIQDAPPGFGDPTELLRHAVQMNFEVTLLQDMKDDGGGASLLGLALKDENKRTTKIYLDSQTNLPRRIMAETGTLDVTLGDYHVTETVKLPGSLKVTQNGKALVTLKFSSWSINKPVDEKLFMRPKS
jgi:zinc protease